MSEIEPLICSRFPRTKPSNALPRQRYPLARAAVCPGVFGDAGGELARACGRSRATDRRFIDAAALAHLAAVGNHQPGLDLPAAGRPVGSIEPQATDAQDRKEAITDAHEQP